MKKYFRILCFILFLSICSCNHKDLNVEYYSHSDLKYKVTHHYSKYDSVVYFYRNGKVFKSGKKDKKNRYFGKWNYYNIEGFLSETREFFVIRKNCKLNQIWFYNKKGDTILSPSKFNTYRQKEFETDTGFDSSIFVKIYCDPKKDTLKLYEKMSVDIINATPFWANKGSECYVILAKGENHNFNSDFSNLNQVKIDTIRNLYSIKSNRTLMNSKDLKQRIGFNISFKTKGKKILRGYLVENWNRNATIDDSIKNRSRIAYFEKVIYVKDTIQKKKNGL